MRVFVWGAQENRRSKSLRGDRRWKRRREGKDNRFLKDSPLWGVAEELCALQLPAAADGTTVVSSLALEMPAALDRILGTALVHPKQATSLITILGKRCALREVLLVLQWLQRVGGRMNPNEYTYGAAVTAAARSADPQTAEHFIAQATNNGVQVLLTTQHYLCEDAAFRMCTDTLFTLYF